MYKRIVFLLILLASCNVVRASHIVGGEIYYDYLGNNNYRFYIAVYRDCASTGAEFDAPLILTVYSANGLMVQNLSVPYPGKVNLPVVFNNPCVTPPSGICVERAIYEVVINLPPTAGGYTVAYQRCCRGPNISNLSNPDDTGLTLSTKVPGSGNNFFQNSSPRFTNYPPLLLCNNEDLVFDHSATDPDGDQLEYELITPASGANSFNPAPNPAPAPPYAPVFWAGGFNAAQPLGTGSTMTINPTTGLLIADPEMLGLFVVGIRVKEYRNGVLIGFTDRDFLFKVVNCVVTLQSIITPQDELTTFVDYCQGSTITFNNESYGATSYEWDFGVPGITTDVSTSFEPTYTFPGPGEYEVTLVANPGWPCTDTSTQIFTIYENMNVSFSVEDSVCLQGNSLDFVGNYQGPAGASYSWNFGTNASPNSATSLSVNDVSFTQSGFIPVTITSTFENCEREFTSEIYIFPEPDANFLLPATLECGGLTVTFNNTSDAAAGYTWDFGVPGITDDVSTEFSPTYTFPSGGTYPVTLVASSNSICQDTLIQEITVNEALVVSFTSEDSLCVTNNVFNFNGVFSGPDNSVLTWNFGPNASQQTATTLNVPNISFDTSGIFPVTFTASFGNCSDSYTGSIFIFKEPSIEFDILPGLQCAPFLAQFVDLSSADSPILYSWDFGDGNTSTSANPSNIYFTPGEYAVSLTIITPFGCVDTLSLVKDPFVFVRPSPTASFVVDPSETDICNAEIQFTDQSLGAYSYLYILDENGRVSEQSNPLITYFTSGTKNPLQIVTNEYGCSDSAYAVIAIEPVSVFVPNTFTPDGNEFNNIFNAETDFPMFSWDLKIYNRWGQVVFQSSDPSIGWDGTLDGQIMQDGLYVYRIKYMSCESTDEVFELDGHVNLMR